MEVLIQDVVDGRAEMHQDLTEQLDKVRLELDRHTSYLRSIKRQLRTFSPRTLFIIIVVGFLLWCALLFYVL